MIELTAKPREEGEFLVGDCVFVEHNTPDGHPHEGVVVVPLNSYNGYNEYVLVAFPECTGQGHNGECATHREAVSEIAESSGWWVSPRQLKLLD